MKILLSSLIGSLIGPAIAIGLILLTRSCQ